MPTKKKATKKSSKQKTFLKKVGDAASHIKDEMITGKDHIVEFAGEAIGSIKEGVKHLVQKKKPKKSAKKKSIKKAAVKKVTPIKKTAKKTTKKVARKR